MFGASLTSGISEDWGTLDAGLACPDFGNELALISGRVFDGKGVRG